MIQNHPPTPIRNSKYLAIPPTPLPLHNIKMAPNPKCHYLSFTDPPATQPNMPRPILTPAIFGGICLDLFHFYYQIPAIFGQWRNLFGSILFLLQNSCHFWTVEESVRIYFLCTSNSDIIATSTLNLQPLLSFYIHRP